MVVTRARSSRRHRSNRIDTPPRVVVVVDGDDDGDGVDGDGDGVDARATTRGRVGAAPVPMESITASRATEPTHARMHARAHRRDDLDDDASPSDRVRSSTRAHRRPLTRVVTSASSEMHLWERRARASPPHRRTTVTHRRRVSHDGTLWYASRRRDDPSRRCRSRSRDASERQFASAGNA